MGNPIPKEGMVAKMGFGWISLKQNTCCDGERWASWELWYWWKLLSVVVGPWKSKAWIIGRSTMVDRGEVIAINDSIQRGKGC